MTGITRPRDILDALLTHPLRIGEQIPDLSGRGADRALLPMKLRHVRASPFMQRLMIITHLGLGMHAGVAALASRLRRHDSGFRHARHCRIPWPTQSNDAGNCQPNHAARWSGMGAMVGAMAAFLAEDGFQGAPAITVEQASEYWSDLGANFTINQNYIKPYPICRWAHAAIDALGSILDQHDLDNQDIAHIEVRARFRKQRHYFKGCGTPVHQAQYSLPFALAVRLLHGEIAPDHIQGAALGES